ncbi:hypothetical protein CEXT_242991 [Caerostris extrusa]|uniref:Uncharacterized protein n=1 Tax=Caerostris extrusa TaxID=172846 RepID=A0AAV4Y8L5_CAEEX|nr:hypothetical protein CEXT_242991 [Caerostris extrusa]
MSVSNSLFPISKINFLPRKKNLTHEKSLFITYLPLFQEDQYLEKRSEKVRTETDVTKFSQTLLRWRCPLWPTERDGAPGAHTSASCSLSTEWQRKGKSVTWHSIKTRDPRDATLHCRGPGMGKIVKKGRAAQYYCFVLYPAYNFDEYYCAQKEIAATKLFPTLSKQQHLGKGLFLNEKRVPCWNISGTE